MARPHNEPDSAMDEAGGLQRRRIDDSMRRRDDFSSNLTADRKEGHLHR